MARLLCEVRSECPWCRRGVAVEKALTVTLSPAEVSTLGFLLAAEVDHCQKSAAWILDQKGGWYRETPEARMGAAAPYLTRQKAAEELLKKLEG
jgi:hypothetical protein